jgi:ABC-type phosphate transport system permease subunit
VIGYRTAVTVVETLLVLAVIPAAVYGLITLIALWPKLTRVRYRPGQQWEFAPVFWVANPTGVSDSAPSADPELENDAAQRGTARGGARGNW